MRAYSISPTAKGNVEFGTQSAAMSAVDKTIRHAREDGFKQRWLCLTMLEAHSPLCFFAGRLRSLECKPFEILLPAAKLELFIFACPKSDREREGERCAADCADIPSSLPLQCHEFSFLSCRSSSFSFLGRRGVAPCGNDGSVQRHKQERKK